MTQKNIGIRLLAEDIEKRPLHRKSGTLSCHNFKRKIQLYLVASTRNCHTRTLIRAQVWSVWWRVIQGAKTNFETDLFMPIIREVEKLSGKVYDQDGDNMSFKVIADHIRSLSFAIG